MKKGLGILFFISSILFAQAQTKKYVSLMGVDVPTSGSINSPYRTITYAANSLVAGDTLFVRGGAYTNATYGDNYYWNQDRTARVSGINGTATQYIVIMPYNNESVILKGDGDFILQVTGSSYVKVQGFEVYGETENITLPLAFQYQFAFRRTTNTGINTVHENRVPVGTNTDQSGLEDISNLTIFRPYYFFTHGIVVQNSHHIDIIGNTVHHVPGEGIRFAGSDYINCNKNIVHNNSRRSSTGVHGISCYTLKSIDNSTATKIIFDGNTVYDNYNEVFSWSEGKTVISAIIDEGKGLTIQRCFAAGAGEWDFGRILFVNNIAYRNGLAGIHVNDGDRIDIINNTVYSNDRYGSGNNLGISLAGANDVKVYNNIVQANLAWGGYTISATPSSTGVVVSNNLVNGGLDNEVNAIDVNTISGTATFVDAAARNFRLQSTSLGINNALATVAPSIDYYNTVRDVQPDRGAIEFSNIVLPIKMKWFDGHFLNNNALLSWETTIEISSKLFEIEHAFDGLNFRKIDAVPANSFASSYQYTHLNITNGKNYYRLKQIDNDGKFEYSKIVLVEKKSKEELSFFPNPTKDVVVITKPNTFLDKIAVYNASGLNVTNTVAITRTENSIKINLEKVSAGIYFIKLKNNNYKILKQ
jgi:parallel beta-helix repeat protein